jgi:transglutaminase-like putative cysteine protease
VVRNPIVAGHGSVDLAAVNARFLTANDRVPVAGDLIDRIRRDLPPHGADPVSKARAIYDHVLANMTYQKVGTSWGNGDTYCGCSEKYGNCTDFHALFISLARAEGLPARFEIGLPVPMDRASGKIGGYHCWLEFYIAGQGWFPVDASEASKHPERREAFFGSQPPDRLRLTTGRDLTLHPTQTSGPLNYFVYPHVEVDGVRSDAYSAEFTYSRDHRN